MAKTEIHEYESDPQSGAGNCVCGYAERHRKHFHNFVPAMSQPDICTCGLRENEIRHWIMNKELINGEA